MVWALNSHFLAAFGYATIDQRKPIAQRAGASDWSQKTPSYRTTLSNPLPVNCSNLTRLRTFCVLGALPCFLPLVSYHGMILFLRLSKWILSSCCTVHEYFSVLQCVENPRPLFSFLQGRVYLPGASPEVCLGELFEHDF